MGRLFLIEYDQIPGKNFYLCRLCQTHLAVAQDVLCQTLMTKFGVFEKVVNMLIDGPVHHDRSSNGTTTDAFCTKCNTELGWKYVQVDEPTMDIREGRIVLDMDKLLYWNGYELVDG
ncbi:hypothetical protein I3843_14G072200 [Carya illinoinensis]|uniref:Protein yippee-like n=1 Tax=Carya illinoinensis TaxID=32201 RepID=A0A8T1NHL1_CARIL|nr:protein yippee-like At3g08990 isoform X1 [Carya illinoinensis]KAG6629251.1 hypothetical protein CIPAW_14G071600 [Carya illinoinensis]KAG7947016.1 hypothetical protein I3843_14G072200 [Carya illinoinensis]